MDQGFGADEAGEDEGMSPPSTLTVNFYIQSYNESVGRPCWQSLTDYSYMMMMKKKNGMAMEWWS